MALRSRQIQLCSSLLQSNGRTRSPGYRCAQCWNGPLGLDCHRRGLRRYVCQVRNTLPKDQIPMGPSRCSLQVNMTTTGWLAVRSLPVLSCTPDLNSSDIRLHRVIVASGVHGGAKFQQQDESNIIKALNSKEKARLDDTYNISKREQDSGQVCTAPLLRRRNSHRCFYGPRTRLPYGKPSYHIFGQPRSL